VLPSTERKFRQHAAEAVAAGTPDRDGTMRIAPLTGENEAGLVRRIPLPFLELLADPGHGGDAARGLRGDAPRYVPIGMGWNRSARWKRYTRDLLPANIAAESQLSEAIFVNLSTCIFSDALAEQNLLMAVGCLR